VKCTLLLSSKLLPPPRGEGELPSLAITYPRRYQVKAFFAAALIMGAFCVCAYVFVIEPVLTTMGSGLPF